MNEKAVPQLIPMTSAQFIDHMRNVRDFLEELGMDRLNANFCVAKELTKGFRPYVGDSRKPELQPMPSGSSKDGEPYYLD